MVLDKRNREQMLAHCGEIQADDGVDPRKFFQAGRVHQKTDHKAKQLCRQVAETLDQVLAGETGDDVLRRHRVSGVVPAPDASRLLVTLHADCASDALDRRQVEQRLAACSGRLRSEIAAAITRKKTPTLVFNVVGPIDSLNATTIMCNKKRTSASRSGFIAKERSRLVRTNQVSFQGRWGQLVSTPRDAVAARRCGRVLTEQVEN